MSTSIFEETLSTATVVEPEEPRLPTTPRPMRKAPSFLAAPRALAGLGCVVGLVFLFFGARPLWHTDVWRHLSYGRLMWQTQSLPTTEPLMPLAQGMPLTDTAWLSQLIGYGVMNALGAAGLQGLSAVAIASCVAMLTWRSYRTTRNGTFATYGVIVFLLVAWGTLNVVRPQLAGLVCFTALLVRMTSRKTSRSDWLLVPALFAAWANLDSSFVCGLFLLACFAIGRSIDVTQRRGALSGMGSSDRLRRTFLLLELAAAATLLNPYGLGLIAEILTQGGNPNLRDLSEWNPLSFRDFAGQVFVAMTVLLAVLYRWTPRRVRSWEVLALVGFGCASLWSSSNLIWWAPVAALLVVHHIYAILKAAKNTSVVSTPSPTSPLKEDVEHVSNVLFLEENGHVGNVPHVSQPSARGIVWTIAMCAAIYVSFAFSPLGGRVLHGRQLELKQSVTNRTPIAAVEYLKQNPPQGQIFNISEWGDFLAWEGPPGLRVFVNSQVDLIPLDVWQRYMQIIEQKGNWEEVLDRYAVNTIVVDTERCGPLVFKLNRMADVWRFAFEQDGQVIFVRRNPL